MCPSWGFGGHSFLWLLLLTGCLVFFFNRNRFCASKASVGNENTILAEEVHKLRQEIDLLKKARDEDVRS